MAQIDKIIKQEDSEVEQDGVKKVAVELQFTIERGEEKQGFSQNCYFPVDTLDDEAQKYADNYEEEYNKANPVPEKEEETTE